MPYTDSLIDVLPKWDIPFCGWCDCDFLTKWDKFCDFVCSNVKIIPSGLTFY